MTCNQKFTNSYAGNNILKDKMQKLNTGSSNHEHSEGGFLSKISLLSQDPYGTINEVSENSPDPSLGISDVSTVQNSCDNGARSVKPIRPITRQFHQVLSYKSKL